MKYPRDERLRDLEDLFKVRTARSAWYPSFKTWKKKAEQLGVDEAMFERWAATKRWFVNPDGTIAKD